MTDTSLFQPEEVRIEPAPDRHEPVIWVRRLVVVEERAIGVEPVREIEFHRGLNIIVTAEATESDTEPVGHNVGKTLLTRLIRFCLGEAHFADSATRAAIREVFPLGYVMAEIVLNGNCWCVARPIGSDPSRNAWACETDDWHVLLGATDQLVGYDAFRDAVEAATVLINLDGIMFPAAERAIRWLDLLGWLSRDQYCRYRHPHEWRSAEADSGTANPSKDDAAFMVRACIGLMDASERQIIANRREAVRRKEQLELEQQRLERRVEYARENLIHHLGLSEDAIIGPAFGHVARQQAEERRQRLVGLLEDIINDAILRELEERTTSTAETLGERIGELNQLQARRTEEVTRLEQARTAGRDDFYAGLADPVANCPATDCPMRRDSPSSEDQPWRQQEIDNLIARVAERDRQIEEREAAKHSAEQELKEIQRQHTDRRGTVLSDRAAIERQIGALDSLAAEGVRYREWHEELDQMESRIATADARIERLREQQRQAQDRLAEMRRRFGEYFNYVVRALVGDAVEGRLDLTLRGLELSLDDIAASTGEALSTSSKVLSLDLASLIGSVCGLGHHPRFIIHDSPREADLEPHIYGRLFRLVHEIEQLMVGRVSFQYIVTTTTSPPPDLAREPHVVCSLHRRSEDGMLLRKRL